MRILVVTNDFYCFLGLMATLIGSIGSMIVLASLNLSSLGVSGVATTSYFSSSLVRVDLISSHANLIPTHVLGPIPNGMYTAGWRLISGENRSGLNSWASGPQCSGSKCRVKLSTATVKFSGMLIPLMVHALVHRRAITL